MTVFLDRQDAALKRVADAARAPVNETMSRPDLITVTTYPKRGWWARHRRTIGRVALVLLAIAALAVLPPLVGLP